VDVVLSFLFALWNYAHDDIHEWWIVFR